MLRTFIVFALLVVVFHSCLNPINRNYSEETLDRDISELYVQMDSSSVSLILDAITRKSDKNKPLSKYTYGELLEDEKKWKDNMAKNRKSTPAKVPDLIQ